MRRRLGKSHGVFEGGYGPGLGSAERFGAERSAGMCIMTTCPGGLGP